MAGGSLIRFTKNNPLTIGLTGGPGVGKSEVAAELENMGVYVINADKIGHELIESNGTVRRKLIKLLGGDIVGRDGSLQRKIIGGIVFSDRHMMSEFNAIIHPALLKELKTRLKQAALSGRYNVVVVDAALIFEWGIADWFEMILVVDALRDLRLSRISKNGVSKSQAARRIGSQIPQREKIALADYVIANNATKSVLRKKAKSFYAELIKLSLIKK